MSELRGIPDELITVPHTRVHGVREDGQPKGYGFFGPLAHAEEESCYATELPFYIGTRMYIPLLVPGLSRAEISHLVCGGRVTSEILATAMAHAAHRRALGLPVFAAITETPIALPE